MYLDKYALKAHYFPKLQVRCESYTWIYLRPHELQKSSDSSLHLPHWYSSSAALSEDRNTNTSRQQQIIMLTF